MSSSMVLMVFVGVVILWVYSIYASLIRKRNKAMEAFSSIDVQLKKRYDLIPNILTIAKKFMDHEKELMEDITKLRTSVMNLSDSSLSIDRKIALDSQIAEKMKQLIVAVENYPDIKSDATMVTAMQTYNEVEAHISAARRFYNSAVLDLKNAVEIFPSSLVARLINIKPVDFYNVEPIERQVINAKDFLN